MAAAHPPASEAETSRAEPAFRALVRIYGSLDRVMTPFFAGFGITGAQWGVLRALHNADAAGRDAMSVTELSGSLVIRPPSVTGVVDRMVRQGLVSREPLPSDMRVKQIRLKDKGKAVVQGILARYESQIDRLLGGLTPGDQTELHRLLTAMGDHLQLIIQENVVSAEAGGRSIET